MRPPYRAGTGRYAIAYIFCLFFHSLSRLSVLQSPILAALLLPGFQDLYPTSASSPATLLGPTNKSCCPAARTLTRAAGSKPHRHVFLTHFSCRPAHARNWQTPPSLTIKTGLASHASESSDSSSSRTAMPHSSQRQYRWSELVPPQTALTFVAMYDPAEGLLTFSGASLLPSEPPTPPTPDTPDTPGLDTPDTPTAFVPMPRTPAPSTLAGMQSLLDAYFRSAGTTGNHALPARASSTFDGLLYVAPESGSSKTGCWREKPLPMRPPSPPDRDSVFAWSRLGRMAQDDPREPWDARGNDRGCMYCPSAPDSGYSSASSDDVAWDSDDGDSFYFTPPEIEDPNEVRISP